MKMIEWLTSKLPDRAHVRSIIFGMNTPTGRLFDILLLCLILLSVIVVSAESTVGLSHSTRNFLHWCEWVITIVFTIEYILRIYCLHKPWRYILSFYGIIDLISILPSYIALIYSGAQVLMVFRILRLLRIFRILSLNNLVSAGDMLVRSIRASMAKIMVFMLLFWCPTHIRLFSCSDCCLRSWHLREVPVGFVRWP
ncbi:ion transporter [Porphyromonas gingivalis]|uniref:ion transporter n=1 Tax=Porphyromonas gingivalis TaxID=837 RepID=UPI001E2F0699|nr:ion transporter [Porphyromonas gingivalis]